MRAGTSVAAARAGVDRCSERDQISHRLDHRHGAAGQNTVRPARDTVLHVEVDAGQRVTAVSRAPRRNRIGHERNTSRGDLPDQTRSVVRQMHSVEDDLHDDICGKQRAPASPARARRTDALR